MTSQVHIRPPTSFGEAEESAHATWPPERFFWSVVELPPGISVRRGVPPVALRHQFEDDIPPAWEDVHAVCAATKDGRAVLCAGRLADLRSVVTGTLSLCPLSLPAFLSGALDPSALNLLTGSLQPLPVRRAHRRSHGAAAAALAACAAILSWGFERRSAAWTLRAGTAEAVEARILSEVAPGRDRSSLASELEALHAAERAGAESQTPGDASLALASVLAGWPRAAECLTESIAASATTASISVSLGGDPSAFLEGLTAPEGWSLEEPRISRTGTEGSRTRLFVRLTRREADH